MGIEGIYIQSGSMGVNFLYAVRLLIPLRGSIVLKEVSKIGVQFSEQFKASSIALKS
jgi:hypothetical protein